ncbi:hypothetical protein NDU88_001592 [Pleurodeles waltl]|uniref:Uncharacterized protein n=1 Tax=Pleurodeles waltl TaxID=8319 RepID=A0AAV7MNW4_PLEWA|nr:hypothetical protein NDU88_001592 [Pleurodeles waltl]
MARQISFFWWALTYMKCTGEEEKSLPTAPSKHRPLGHVRRWRNPPVYRPLVDLSTMEERNLIITYSAAVCTANGIPRLKDHRVDSYVVIVWAYFCWRDGGGFFFASLSLTFGVANACGSLNFVGFRDVGHNSCAGIPRPRRCVGGLLHGGKRLLPPML